jgi:hypothetical protein
MRSSSQREGAALSAPVSARSLSAREWVDLAVAGIELAIARFRLATAGRAALLAPPTAARRPASKVDRRIVRVRLAIARTGHRLPWRADCLVQAIAAQHWLRRLGVQTSLRIGVPGKINDPFEAHAWLMCGDEVVTGGDIGDYIPLLDSVSRVEPCPTRRI